jgi:DNA-binding transcriptional LysR family regulator
MPRTLADLANERLIHLEEPFRPAANWNEWFQSAGIDSAVVNRGLLINDYVSVIQAVMEGQGVALGWRHLTDRLIASGLLVRVSDHVMTTGKGFHVAWPKNRALSEGARQVRDWIAAQG